MNINNCREPVLIKSIVIQPKFELQYENTPILNNHAMQVPVEYNYERYFGDIRSGTIRRGNLIGFNFDKYA